MLHDKATRGEVLTAEEETELAAWHARLDQEEDTLQTSFSRSSLAADMRQAEIEKALTHLQTTAQQVREQLNENEALRREIAALTQQLAQTKTLQPARVFLRSCGKVSGSEPISPANTVA